MTRTMHFTFTDEISPKVENRRPHTLRAQCELLLSSKEGATFEAVENLVRVYDASHGKKPTNVRRRTYELIRLMHYTLGHTLEQVDGVIRITNGKKKHGTQLPPSGNRRVRKAPGANR